MLAAVHQYEAPVKQVMGTGIMALFGAPVAHEDHAVRACYAALPPWPRRPRRVGCPSEPRRPRPARARQRGATASSRGARARGGGWQAAEGPEATRAVEAVEKAVCFSYTPTAASTKFSPSRVEVARQKRSAGKRPFGFPILYPELAARSGS